VLSGRLCAEAILADAPDRYRARLDAHPTMRDYALTRELLRAAIALRQRTGVPTAEGGWRSTARRVATARIFAWMFGGRPLPGATLLRAALRRAHDRETLA
jgi:hypothetical protein